VRYLDGQKVRGDESTLWPAIRDDARRPLAVRSVVDERRDDD
jgi:hypothetical protein